MEGFKQGATVGCDGLSPRGSHQSSSRRLWMSLCLWCVGGHPSDTQIASPTVFKTRLIQWGGPPAFPSPAPPPLTFLLQNLRADFLFWHLLRSWAGGQWWRVCACVWRAVRLFGNGPHRNQGRAGGERPRGLPKDGGRICCQGLGDPCVGK